MDEDRMVRLAVATREYRRWNRWCQAAAGVALLALGYGIGHRWALAPALVFAAAALTCYIRSQRVTGAVYAAVTEGLTG